jgi:hypothetical protein
LERRAALRRATYKLATESKEEGEEEDDDDDEFGDFESAEDSPQKWDVLSNSMEALDVKSPPAVQDDHLVRAIKTKEEEYLKQKKDYQHDEEQEGEV